MGKEEDLRRMFQELTGYEKKKIDLKMEGNTSQAPCR